MSEPDNPSAWHQGFLKLSPTNPPCPGFRADEWREIHARAKTFFDGHDLEAAGKGWDGISLFGVHSVVGAANVSASGALMMPGGAIGAITREWISFGQNRYYRSAPQQSAVLVWRFGA